VFENPLATVKADRPEEIMPALAFLEAQLAAGRYAAGYLSYELGYALEPCLLRHLWPARQVPLLWFGIFDAPRDGKGAGAERLLASAGRAYAGPLRAEWDRPAYKTRFDRIRDLIGAGDLYQANLSFRARFAFAGDAMALYRALRAGSGAGHCAFVDDSDRQILSLSPELFFAVTPDGRIAARPMKGTAARDRNPVLDEAARATLAASTKERAENLMIVDLMRNDLSRIASIGSVRVDALFEIESYPTVHQMVSAIRANLSPGTPIAQIIRAIFPCGSVTGAPKIRAMEVIREAETSPRGVYCGAIGAFSPDGSARFNVAIRTLTISGGAGELGIGGAIVYDSNAQSEYDECLLKARFYETARRPLELIETLRFSPRDGFVRLQHHLARMARSAAAFAIPFDRAAAIAALENAASAASGDLRVRLTLSEQGIVACEAHPFDPAPPAPWRYALSSRRVDSMDVLLRHKTSRRETYEEEYARAVREQGADEIVFQNEKGELTEGSRTTLFACFDGRLVTPQLEAGLLDGCLRRALIEEGRCIEMTLKPEDLARAETVYLGNSLRGLIRAVPANGARSSIA
jgi:para-aminobenzoate synthetase/4-amino-4-deoxychorismate lyase